MGSLKKYTPQQVFQNDSIIKRFEKILGDNARGFVTSVLQVINDSSKLKNADPDSIFNAAMTAASLDLPINPNLGFAYIIPYNIKNKGVVAQFQMGYKGYIQLAQRTGMYLTISSSEIYEGQLVKENPLTGYEFDFDVRSGDEIIGYAAYFKLRNGFEKTSYMSVDDAEKHAIEYVPAYKGKNNKDSYGNWKDNFDDMARKTVLKLMLKKYGPLSVDMQTAITADQAIIKDHESMEVDYPGSLSIDQPTEGRTPIDIDDNNNASRQSLDEQAKGTAFEGS